MDLPREDREGPEAEHQDRVGRESVQRVGVLDLSSVTRGGDTDEDRREQRGRGKTDEASHVAPACRQEGADGDREVVDSKDVAALEAAELEGETAERHEREAEDE